MRNSIVPAVLGLRLAAMVGVSGGCEAGPRDAVEPPVLAITSPSRSLVQNGAGKVMVRGTVAPNAAGDPIDTVTVNNVAAQRDGNMFTALIDVSDGATLIHTVARDANGTEVTDTRAVHAGQLRPVGTPIERAITAALSAEAFAKISAAAGPIIEGLDLGAMIAPLQPILHANDPDGEDCLFGRVFVDDVRLADISISLMPGAGGLAFRAEIAGLAVDGRVRYAFACADGETALSATTERITVAGTLEVTPNGMAGFTTRLASPQVSVTGFRMTVSGLPGDIFDLLNLDSLIEQILPPVAELAMNPLVNQALGALAGPLSLDVLDTELTMQVAPSQVAFSAQGATVAMTISALLAGSEASPGFIYTGNGTPRMDPGQGFHLGVADDLANQMLAQAQASGLLDLALPTPGGAFDTAQVHMTLPPLISADAAGGKMRLVLGDMIATFMNRGTAVGQAAINATVDLQIASTGDGHGVALQLGTPEIHLDVVDGVPNTTGLGDEQLASAASGGLTEQIRSISALLAAIPIPALAGLQMRDLSIGADAGYVMVKGRFE